MAAALSVATAAVAVAGSARAQATAPISVLPAAADPGGVVTVSHGPTSPCPPPAGTRNPSASVDLFTVGSVTPVNQAPFQGPVTPIGTWSVEVRLAPDLPPGQYRVQAGCYTDSGLNAGFGPAYASGGLEVRLQAPGLPSASPRRGRPGENVQVASGEAGCRPPVGAPSPRVRVSLLDAGKATRAEAEGPVDATTGRWTVSLRVPDLAAQNVEITAVCLARVGAPSPYARYQSATFAVDAAPPPAPTTIAAPTSTVASGGSTSVPPTTSTPAASLPPTPLAVPIVAEPTYTG